MIGISAYSYLQRTSLRYGKATFLVLCCWNCMFFKVPFQFKSSSIRESYGCGSIEEAEASTVVEEGATSVEEAAATVLSCGTLQGVDGRPMVPQSPWTLLELACLIAREPDVFLGVRAREVKEDEGIHQGLLKLLWSVEDASPGWGTMSCVLCPLGPPKGCWSEQSFSAFITSGHSWASLN
jgi:hypothetical protein